MGANATVGDQHTAADGNRESDKHSKSGMLFHGELRLRDHCVLATFNAATEGPGTRCLSQGWTQ